MAKVIFDFDRSNAGHLHCDACGFEMPEKTAFTPALIGTPCPVCGADMLTRSDYEKTEKLFKNLDRINRWFGPLLGRERSSPGGLSMQVKIHDDELLIREVSHDDA